MAQADVGRLEQDVADIKADVQSLGERMARLEGAFEQFAAQMDKRLGNVEQTQRWALGTYAVLILAVLGLYFKGSL